MTNERVMGENQQDGEAPPERWSVEMPHDLSDWMDRRFDTRMTRTSTACRRNLRPRRRPAPSRISSWLTPDRASHPDQSLRADAPVISFRVSATPAYTRFANSGSMSTAR